MNTSAFSDFTPTPALVADDVVLTMFANAIDKIDGLHRGPGRCKPRRIPLNRQWDHDESRALNIACDIKPNQNPHLKSSSATSTATTNTNTISSYTGHYDPSIKSLALSPSSSSSPTSTSTTPQAKPPVDVGIPLSLEVSSHSSFTAPVNFGGDDNGDEDASLDESDLPNAPGRKKRGRSRFREQLNDIEPRSSRRRRYKSPNHNLRSALREIQVEIDYMSSDEECVRNDKERLAEDTSGWAALMSLFMN